MTVPGCYDPATGKTLIWNEIATEVDIDSEKSVETVNTGYYNIFKVTDRDEIAAIAVNCNLIVSRPTLDQALVVGLVIPKSFEPWRTKK